MKKILFPGLFALLIAGLFNSCETVTTNLNVDFGYEYFPLETGKYIIYDADSVIYDQANNFTIIDTISFQVMERVEDSFLDNSGKEVYRIGRFRRANAGAAWTPTDVWVATISATKAERIEENLRFIKMIFPASVDTDPWNGNAFLDENTTIPVAGESIVVFKNWLYQYLAKGEPAQFGGLSFDSTLKIQQADEENLIELRYSQEVYAQNVGLIYKELKILDTQCISQCEGESWEEKAEKGFIFRLTVREHN